ncbi:recombinase family protein [Mucilaginibacter sp. L3T2-6]|uniref:recombinase family protein n=1 Tax=Mucilaginibacter sp. L3T2-6 TaxID=3062491 RepID=UPI0034A0B299
MVENSIFNTFAKGSRLAQAKKGTNCVIYTRVSTKEQADKNLSLDTQRKACTIYTERHGYTVLANFGGTFESAQTDERREFASMLAFVKKSKARVSYIIVYSLERFSRNDNSIWLSGQLRKLGIEIVSVTQPIDTSSSSGQMQQKMLFLFGEFDNQLRKEKCMAGIKEMLLRGDWPTSPPLGYDSVNMNGKRKLVINQKGKLLRQAFTWKAEELLNNEAIRQRLAEKGLKLNHQRISELFRNPFYCGLMAHNMLEGRVVEGNHEKLVSKDIFLQVNGLLDQNAHGYKLVEENPAIPLKCFIRCEQCGKLLRGYIVKKKDIHYYKCSTVGCCVNKNAIALNQRFYGILEYFGLPEDAPKESTDLIRAQMTAKFNEMNDSHQDDLGVLESQLFDLNKKIERLEERYVEEEMNADLYNKYAAKYYAEKREIEAVLLQSAGRVSNLSQAISIALGLVSKMAFKWRNGNYYTKQRIQFLLFPSGISYCKKTDGCRTSRINFLFLYLAYLQQIISNKKSGIPELNLDFAAFAGLVAGSRIELPTLGL